MAQEPDKLAIVAGNGKLPVILAKSALELGFSPCGIAVTEEARQNLEGICSKVYRFSPGQIKKMLDCIKKEVIRQVVFIGKVPKLDLLLNLHKLDWIAIQNLSKLNNLNDDSIHSAISDYLKKENINILPQSLFLKNLFFKKEILSKRQPTLEERIDIEYGYEIAKKIAGLDIGQAVVVRNKMILAIEAIEGTDETIKRGCQLSKSEVVVIKVSKPGQDERFDMPAIGTQTIQILSKYGGGILAFEANKTIVLNKDEVIKTADNLNVCLMAI